MSGTAPGDMSHYHKPVVATGEENWPLDVPEPSLCLGWTWHKNLSEGHPSLVAGSHRPSRFGGEVAGSDHRVFGKVPAAGAPGQAVQRNKERLGRYNRRWS